MILVYQYEKTSPVIFPEQSACCSEVQNDARMSYYSMKNSNSGRDVLD
jgi:hypothetical protein